jgi:hypothetical protein
VSPAELLGQIDRQAAAAEARAQQLREVGSRLRDALAAAAGMLAEAAPPPSPEAARRRGRPPRGSPTTTLGNGACGAPAPPGEGTPKVDRRRARRRYPIGASKSERDLFRLREEHPALADEVVAGTRSLRSARLLCGWIKEPPAKATTAAPLEEPAPAVLEEPAPETPAPLEEPPTEPAAEPLEEPPAPAPKRRRMRDYNNPTKTWSPSDVYTPGQRDQDPKVGDVTPANPVLAETLEAAIEAESRAAAALEAHRRNRLASEPSPRWSEGVAAEI